jgi:hypothetical protein
MELGFIFNIFVIPTFKQNKKKELKDASIWNQ